MTKDYSAYIIKNIDNVQALLTVHMYSYVYNNGFMIFNGNNIFNV